MSETARVRADPLAGRAAVADEVGEAEVEQQENEVARLVKIPDKVDLLLVEDFDAPENFDTAPREQRRSGDR